MDNRAGGRTSGRAASTPRHASHHLRLHAGARLRARWRRGERGAALVEFALLLPLLMLVLFGMIEFGLTYGNYISLRDGVRQAARYGAVGNNGQSSSCSLTGLSDSVPTSTRRLMCLTKNEAGLKVSDTRVKVMSAGPTFTTTGTFAKNDALIICAQVPTKAMTGYLASALTGKTLRVKVATRIEKSDSTLQAAEETPPTGQNWSWCTASSVATG